MSKNNTTSGNENFEDELFDVEGYDNVIVLEDEDGNEVEFELLDVMEYENESYAVLTDTQAKENAEVIILRIKPDGDDNFSFEGIEDEALVNTVYDLFKKEHKDDYNFSE